MTRLLELFEDEKQRLSMTRLLNFLAFFPASYVVIVNAESLGATEILGVYLSAYVLGYLGGKGIERIKSKKDDDDVQN